MKKLIFTLILIATAVAAAAGTAKPKGTVQSRLTDLETRVVTIERVLRLKPPAVSQAVGKGDEDRLAALEQRVAAIEKLLGPRLAWPRNEGAKARRCGANPRPSCAAAVSGDKKPEVERLSGKIAERVSPTRLKITRPSSGNNATSQNDIYLELPADHAILSYPIGHDLNDISVIKRGNPPGVSGDIYTLPPAARR